MRLNIATAAFMLSAPISVSAAEVAAPVASGGDIPAAFQGRWEPDIDDCANVDSGARVVVHDRSIAYLEARDTVMSATPHGADRVDLRVEHENYDGIERLDRTLVLSDDGETLTLSPYHGVNPVHMRCPQGDSDGE